MRPAILLALALAPPAGGADYFAPSHRISGIGVARDDISQEMLAVRADHMIQSQTFTIMREAQALPGARRITGNSKLQALFRQASASSGMPASIIEAISYLESWGDANAESPAGPKGIMQISQATAVGMGLKVVWATRYKTTHEKAPVKARSRSGKTTYRTVSRKTPYKVMVRDDRLLPDSAIPAAARYLAGMEQKFGGRDWAIFAYHCGQGCVTMMQDLTRRARGISKSQITVPRMFFSCSPAWNRELYEAIQQQMQRDYSPTYWFRVMRAEQLLALYRRDPAEFAALAQEYKSDFVTTRRAPHRLAVWLKREDLLYHNEDDIRADPGKKLTKALDRPDHFGYRINIAADSTANLEYFREAAPAAIGTLTYIAFETRRLFDEMGHTDGKFQPLDVSSLVEPEEFSKLKGRPEALAHASGQVFDIDYSALPPAELECLRFVLDDLGWDGFLGFVEDGRVNLHIGCSPASRAFFASVFQEAVGQ
ncbi:MAG TPA: transglycosylase SLT domain-containing protein [Candidatus Solibacter sp.]|nr:transglycosylase SLT domain-containing protein [Candidatus Solibacter sp.]